MQEELDEANRQLAEFRNQPPPVIDRKSPAPPPRSSATPSPPPITPTPAPTRPISKTEIFLPQYCPSLVRQINEDPRYLNSFRNNTKTQFIDELNQYDDLGVNEVTHYSTQISLIVLSFREILVFLAVIFKLR